MNQTSILRIDLKGENKLTGSIPIDDTYYMYELALSKSIIVWNQNPHVFTLLLGFVQPEPNLYFICLLTYTR